MALYYLVAIFLFLSGVHAADCTARFPLRVNYLNATTKAGNPSTCQDGSPASYFVDFPDVRNLTSPYYNWIIYFGDGETCTGEACDTQCDLGFNTVGGVCEGIQDDFDDAINSASSEELDLDVVKCYLARSQCGSEFFSRLATLTPQSILCREKAPYASFARIWLPMCTLDWFLGRGSQQNVTSTKFRGAFVVDQLFETLDKLYGISQSQLVVLSGTRGGGIGALHSAKYIREKLNGPKVITLVDSAWFVDLEMFAPISEKPQDVYVIDGKLRLDTQEWISFARLNEDCDLKWNVGGPGISQRHRCLIVPELIPSLSQEKIMFVHSQYDLIFLSTFGLLDETASERFFDVSSYALGAINYIESFGSVNRGSVVDAATTGPDNHYFFSPSCGTHGYIIPTNIHRVSRQIQKIGSAGKIGFERTSRTWEQIAVGDLTVEKAVAKWIESEGNLVVLPTSLTNVALGEIAVGVVTDECVGFLCNPTCTEEIFPFRVSYVFGPCGQYVILIYAALMMGTFWLAFVWAYFNVRQFRSKARQYWTAFETGKPLPDFGFELKRSKLMNRNPGMDEEELRQLAKPKPAVMVASPVMAAPPPVMNTPPPPPGMNFSPPPPPVMVQPAAVVAQVEPEEEEDAIDLVALAEALTSPDRATRLAAKKAYKQHQKDMADRRKMEKKSKQEREYFEKEKRAKKEFEERKAAAGLASQQAAAVKAAAAAEKKKNKVDDGASPEVEVEEAVPVVVAEAVEVVAPQRTGRIQQRAQEELLLEAACDNESRPVHLMVKDLSYWAPSRTKSNICSRLFRAPGKKFQILRNVDLAVKPSEMHALMGPSGSGKSTLLDVLALIRDSGDMQGTQYINGVDSQGPNSLFLRDWLRNNVSYVRQTDVLFPLLTVREHLQHCAWLLLPQFMPECKKLRRVQHVIELLDLDGCAETICGDGGVKIEGGISGGQRRRVSVATQLLRLPPCLLLDEPTSGLDSTSALTLCKSLSTLAHQGKMTIIMTIHQPRNEIFSLFDKLTILVAGRIVFSGTPLEAPGHFQLDSKLQDLSVANAILDLLAVAPENEVMEFHNKYAKGALAQRVVADMQAEVTDFDEDMAHDIHEVLRESAMGEGRWSWETPGSSGMQMWVLISRTIKRGGFDLRKSMFLALIGGVVVGLCFLGVNSITSRTALAYLGVATMTFLQGAFLGDRYLGEKQMYDHESTAGSAVQWTSFVFSQFVRDSVTSTMEALCFGLPVYWIGGMNPEGGRFVIYLILLILIAHVCISSNVLVEIDRDNLRAAALVNVAYVGLGALFNGFIIRISDLPVYLSWLPYIMVTYWGFAGILINDFSGDLFGCQASVLECATRTGDVVILQFSFENLDPFVSMLALIGMSLLFKALSVLDFFARYIRGRGKGMKIVPGGDSLIPDGSRAFKGNLVGNSMKAMMKNKGNAGERMLEANKAQNQMDIKRVQDTTQNGSLVFNEEWDQVKGDSANQVRIAQKQNIVVSLFLSRSSWFFLCGVDVGILGVCCALSADDLALVYAFVSVNMVVAVLFLIQFFVSIFRMVPITPTGPKDCTWAGLNDVIALLMTVADFVLCIQLWTSNAFSSDLSNSLKAQSLTTFLVIAGLCRLTRLIRVYNFWWKVGRYHELQAVSWLMFSEVEREKKMKAAADALLSGGAPH